MSSSNLVEGISRALARRMSGPDAGGITVTHRSPAGLTEGTGTWLNLFCYRTTLNSAFANDAFPDPTRTALEPGQVPPLPLDLHYCLTAHCIDDDDKATELVVQRELVRAMAVIERPPTISPAEVRDALGVDGAHAQGPVAVRIERETMALEDLNRVWAAFQAEFRLGAFYRVSVALIEVGTPPTFTLPVLQRKIGAESAPRAVLGAPRVASGRSVAFPGDVVVVPAAAVPTGARAWFRVPDAAWLTDPSEPIGSLALGVPDADAIRFEIPPANPAPLVPGVVEVLAAPPVLDEAGSDADPLRPDPRATSPGVALRIAPRIDAVVDLGPPPTVIYVDAAVDPATVPVPAGPPGRAADRAVRVDLTPAPRPGQPVTLVLTPPGGTAPPPPPVERLDHDELRFPIAGIAPGRFVLRVRAGGVENAPRLGDAGPAFVEVEL
jgi:hypothetical protein